MGLSPGGSIAKSDYRQMGLSPGGTIARWDYRLVRLPPGGITAMWGYRQVGLLSVGGGSPGGTIAQVGNKH